MATGRVAASAVASIAPGAKPLPGLRDLPALRPASPLPTGVAEVDALLPQGGVPRGAVTELSLAQGLSFGTTLALSVCASAQAEARQRGGDSAFCAFIDPTSSLYAPAASRLGVVLERLLVVRPPVEALARTAARVVQSGVFSVVVIDVAGVPGAPLASSLAPWANAVRRLTLATEGRDTAVLLLTRREAERPLPLPVAMRLELVQDSKTTVQLRLAKERHGHVTGTVRVSFSGPASPLRDDGDGSDTGEIRRAGAS